MWAGVAYELIGASQRKVTLDIFRRAIAKELDKEAFIVEMAKHEYNILLEREKFWTEIWNPWARLVDFPTNKKYWFNRQSGSFDSWFALQTELEIRMDTGYPKKILGAVFDWVMAHDQ